MKKKLKIFLRFFGLQITSTYKINFLEKKNVFNKKQKKKVLISYITSPFPFKTNFSHSNLLECYTAAEIFNCWGYQVDVIDFSLNKKIDYDKYDIIYGMGAILEKSFYLQSSISPKRIFYATGCNPIYSNIETTLRVREFRDKHNLLLMESSRVLHSITHAQTFLSDLVIVLGNKFVLNTYTKFDPNSADRYYNLNAFFYDVYDIDLDKKKYLEAKKHFLWFGSTGLLHKGLDILLDIFVNRQDIVLHICGASPDEQGFLNYYANLNVKSNNIINHGFVKIESEEFKIIMDTCGFIVSPSVSEGGAVALLNVMANGGLVPIITKSCGLDMEDFGWVIEKVDIEMFNMAINQALITSPDELKKKSVKIKNHIRNGYTYKMYKENIKNILSKQLNID